MVISCVIVGCANRFKKSSVKFHRIPTEVCRRQKWLQAISRKDWTPQHSGDRVCGEHFTSGSASSDPNDPDFVPHLKMGYEARSMATPEAKKDRFHRAQRRVYDKLKSEIDVHEKENAASILLELSLSTSINESISTEQQDEDEEYGSRPKSDIHDPCLQKILTLQTENKQVLDDVGVLRKDLQDARHQLGNTKFGDSFLAGEKRGCKDFIFYRSTKPCTFCMAGTVLHICVTIINAT